MGNYSPTQPHADENVLILVASECGGLPRYGGVGRPMAVPPSGSPMPCSQEEYKNICDAVDSLAQYRACPFKCCKPKLGLQVAKDLKAQYPHLMITCTTKWTQFRTGMHDDMYWEYVFEIRRADAVVIGYAVETKDEGNEHDIHASKKLEHGSNVPEKNHPGNHSREQLGPCTTTKVADQSNCFHCLAPMCRV